MERAWGSPKIPAEVHARKNLREIVDYLEAEGAAWEERGAMVCAFGQTMKKMSIILSSAEV